MYSTGLLCLLKHNLSLIVNFFERISFLKLSYETGSSGSSENMSLLIDFFVGVMYMYCGEYFSYGEYCFDFKIFFSELLWVEAYELTC